VELGDCLEKEVSKAPRHDEDREGQHQNVSSSLSSVIVVRATVDRLQWKKIVRDTAKLQTLADV